MDDLTDSNWMLNQDLLPDDTIPQNAQANADFNNSLTPCNVTVDLPSIFPLPQPSAAGLSGNDKSETELRGEDDESLQDEVELLDLHIEDLDLQIRQLQVQRSLTSEQLLNDQDILSLKRQKNELQQRRMTLRRQRRKLLRATEVTDGRPGVFQPAAAVLSVGDDQLPSLESFCTDTNMGSWQNVVLDTIGDIGLASPYHETPEQFSTSITENPQTSYQAVTTALANPTVCSDALTPMEKDAAHPVVAEQEPTLPRKRRRSRTRPVPGYSCFVLGPVSAERERRKMNNDQKRNRKEVVQAGGSCFLCRLDKKKCTGTSPCDYCQGFLTKFSIATTNFTWSCNIRSRLVELNIFASGASVSINTTRSLSVSRLKELVSHSDYFTQVRNINALMEVAGQLPLTPRSIPFSTVDGIPLFLGPSQMLLKTSRMLHNKHVFQLFNPAIEPFIRELRDCSGTLLLHGIDHFMRSALSKEQAVLTMYLLAVVCDAVDKFPVPSNQVEEMVDHLRSVLISYLHVQCTRYFAKRHSKSETTRTHWSPIVEPLDVTAAWLLSFPAISTTTLPSYRKKFPWHVSQALKALKYDHKLMEDAKQSAPLRHVDGYLNEDVQLGYYFLAHSILPEMLKLLDYSSESLVTELLSFEKQMDIGVSSLVLRFEYQRLIKDAMTSQGSEDLHPDKMRFREIFKNHFNVVVDIWMYGAQIEQLPGVRPVMNKVIFHLVLTYSLGLYRDFVLSWGQGQSKSMDWVITQRFTRLSAEAFAIKLWITKELLKLNGHESLSGLPRSVLILTLGSGGDHESLNKFELKKGYGSIERLQQAEELTSEFEALVERGNVYQTLVQIYGILEGFDDGGKEVSE